MNVNTLYIQKEKSGASIKDTVSDFNVYVAEDMPAMDAVEAKVDGNSQDWPDEDGLDVYDADKVYLKEFEVEIPMLCYGDDTASCRAAYKGLIEYLTGKDAAGGTLMMIYQPWVGYGRRHVRYKGTSNSSFWRDGSGYTVYTFTVKVEVCDPVSVVTINSGGTGLVVG